MKKTFCIVFILLQSINLFALNKLEPIIIEDSSSLITPGKKLFFREDKNSTLTYPEVAELKNGWKQSTEKVLNFSFSNSSYWITFSIDRRLDDSSPLILRVPYPLLDRLELYYKHRNESVERVINGDSFPFSKREYKNRDFIFPMHIGRGIHQIYLQVTSTSSLRLPIEIMTLSRFIELNNFELALFWMFYGLMFMLCLHNFYLFITVKEKMYGVFSLFVLAWTLYEAAHNGIGFQYLWSGSIFLQAILLPFSIALSLILICIFFITYLEARKNYIYFYRALILLSVIPGAVMAPLSFILPYSISIKIVLILGLIASPCFFLSLPGPFIKKNDRPGFSLPVSSLCSLDNFSPTSSPGG